ncbi:Target of Myb protein 1 [Varanus komodoensis]|nr:Target of Myb protein 1 [Varanus komodoensis]
MMEFLLGNPFSSPVGQRIEKATDGARQNEDWALNMEICDIINETEEGPKDALRAIKKRIVGNKNFHEVMLALTVLETCVKNCGHRFHVLVASQDFVEGVLVRTILPKNNPPAIVHDKVLTLIQSWADAFRSTPDLTGVVAVYEDLRRKGLEFPMTDLDMLSPIHTPQRTVYNPETPSAVNSSAANSPQVIESILHPVSLPGAPGTSADAPITPTPEQVAKLRSELEVVNGNVKVMSEMLTELVPGQSEPSDLELLQELNRTCKAMQQRVLELIPRILNEQLTEELLIVNDNLNNIFLRHERFERLRSGQPTKVTEHSSPVKHANKGNVERCGNRFEPWFTVLYVLESNIVLGEAISTSEELVEIHNHTLWTSDSECTSGPDRHENFNISGPSITLVMSQLKKEGDIFLMSCVLHFPSCSTHITSQIGPCFCRNAMVIENSTRIQQQNSAANASNLIDVEPNATLVEKEPEAPNTLSSQLAGMNLGSGSVSAGLMSLNNSGKLEEEFDMFALTRGSSLAEQRKEAQGSLHHAPPPSYPHNNNPVRVKYEDPLAKKGLAGALDARQQNTGAIPVPQAAIMEDIEKWLSSDVGNETVDPKGVTSEGKLLLNPTPLFKRLLSHSFS